MSKPISKTNANVISTFELDMLLVTRPTTSNGKRRYDLWVKHHGVCDCCGIQTSFTELKSDKLATIEHIICQKNFQKHSHERNAQSNLTMTCLGCNSTRGDFGYENFKEAVRIYGRPDGTNNKTLRNHCAVAENRPVSVKNISVKKKKEKVDIAEKAIIDAVVHAIHNTETNRNRKTAGKFQWIKDLMAA